MKVDLSRLWNGIFVCVDGLYNNINEKRVSLKYAKLFQQYYKLCNSSITVLRTNFPETVHKLLELVVGAAGESIASKIFNDKFAVKHGLVFGPLHVVSVLSSTNGIL